MQPLRVNASRRPVASFYHSLPPIEGWNTIDPLGVPPGKERSGALILDNFVATASDLVLRRGYTIHSTGIEGAINSLMPYHGTIEKLFAASGSQIFDATGISAVNAISGLASDFWQHVNISTPGGRFLYLANGVDTMRLWDGTVWTSITGVSSPAITGVTTTTIISLNLHKSRLWLVQSGTLTAWYLPVNSVGGAATSFDLRSIARQGGVLQAIGTWTVDAGNGPDDLLVFVTSKGEAIVYSGADPASNFSLVGRYDIASPIGRRCLLQYAGDLLILTLEGVVPMSTVVSSGDKDKSSYVSRTIQPSFSAASALHGGNPGWEIFSYPRESMAWVNIPVSITTAEQYVLKILNRPGSRNPWSRFTQVPANCWALFNDEPYFGGDDNVYRFWSGSSDSGINITGFIKPQFGSFGPQGVRKRFLLFRVFMLASSNPSVGVLLNVDYEDKLPLTLTDLPGGELGSAIWDISKWDKAIWSGAGTRFMVEIAPGAEGIVAAPVIKTSTRIEELRIVALQYITSKGEV